MKIAFDFDGTITAFPKTMDALATSFHDAGFQVVVLTAAAGELPAPERPAEVARRLATYGFTCPHVLACVEGRDKGQWCRDNGVTLVIDDDEAYLRTIAAKSPDTIRLHLQRY